MNVLESYRAEIQESFAAFNNNEINEELDKEFIGSPIINHAKPEFIFKKDDYVTVLGYRLSLSTPSKVSLCIKHKDYHKNHYVDVVNVLGKKVSTEISSIVSEYMNWLFGNTSVIESILNFNDQDVNTDLWNESNKQFHLNLQKVLKVRHLSKKFGL